MNPRIILPEADVLPLPAAAWFLQILLHLTFLLHLLAMNALLGSLVLSLFILAPVERTRPHVEKSLTT